MTETMTLWRPTGPAELDLVRAPGWKAWPPRLPLNSRSWRRHRGRQDVPMFDGTRRGRTEHGNHVGYCQG